MTLPLLVIFGLATGPPAGVGDGLRFIPLHALTTLLFALGAFCLCEFRVSQQISTFYGSSVQSMGIQLNVLPALPVLRSERFWLLELRASGTGTKPPRSGNVTVTR